MAFNYNITATPFVPASAFQGYAIADETPSIVYYNGAAPPPPLPQEFSYDDITSLTHARIQEFYHRSQIEYIEAILANDFGEALAHLSNVITARCVARDRYASNINGNTVRGGCDGGHAWILDAICRERTALINYCMGGCVGTYRFTLKMCVDIAANQLGIDLHPDMKPVTMQHVTTARQTCAKVARANRPALPRSQRTVTLADYL